MGTGSPPNAGGASAFRIGPRAPNGSGPPGASAPNVAGAANQEAQKGKEGKFSELVMDAIQSGNVVLVVRTHGKTDREVAKDIIGKSLAGHYRVPTEFN